MTAATPRGRAPLAGPVRGLVTVAALVLVAVVARLCWQALRGS